MATTLTNISLEAIARSAASSLGYTSIKQGRLLPSARALYLQVMSCVNNVVDTYLNITNTGVPNCIPYARA